MFRLPTALLMNSNNGADIPTHQILRTKCTCPSDPQAYVYNYWCPDHMNSYIDSLEVPSYITRPLYHISLLAEPNVELNINKF